MTNDLTKFELAERAEHLAAEIYRELAARFAHDSDRRKVFERLASEEDQHAMRIVTLRRSQETNIKNRDIQLDVGALAGFLAEGELLKKKLAADDSLSITNALAQMADLESKFASVHAEMMVSATDPVLKKFFKQFAAQDKGHAELLTMAGDFGAGALLPGT